jgi:hypothetical protein
MSARYLFSTLTLALMIAVGGNGAWAGGPDPGQVKDETPTSGRIVGVITPQVKSGFHIRLLVPGTTTEIASKDSDADGHFALEDIHPGTYQLDIEDSNGTGGCAHLPWTKKITIRAGKTTTVKAKVEPKPGAACE